MESSRAAGASRAARRPPQSVSRRGAAHRAPPHQESILPHRNPRESIKEQLQARLNVTASEIMRKYKDVHQSASNLMFHLATGALKEVKQGQLAYLRKHGLHQYDVAALVANGARSASPSIGVTYMKSARRHALADLQTMANERVAQAALVTATRQQRAARQLVDKATHVLASYESVMCAETARVATYLNAALGQIVPISDHFRQTRSRHAAKLEHYQK